MTPMVMTGNHWVSQSKNTTCYPKEINSAAPDKGCCLRYLCFSKACVPNTPPHHHHHPPPLLLQLRLNISSGAVSSAPARWPSFRAIKPETVARLCCSSTLPLNFAPTRRAQGEGEGGREGRVIMRRERIDLYKEQLYVLTCVTLLLTIQNRINIRSRCEINTQILFSEWDEGRVRKKRVWGKGREGISSIHVRQIKGNRLKLVAFSWSIHAMNQSGLGILISSDIQQKDSFYFRQIQKDGDDVRATNSTDKCF